MKFINSISNNDNSLQFLKPRSQLYKKMSTLLWIPTFSTTSMLHSKHNLKLKIIPSTCICSWKSLYKQSKYLWNAVVSVLLEFWKGPLILQWFPRHDCSEPWVSDPEPSAGELLGTDLKECSSLKVLTVRGYLEKDQYFLSFTILSVVLYKERLKRLYLICFTVPDLNFCF